MITLSIYEKTDPLCENFQANEMKFAFVNTVSDTEWKTINTMVMCREYFNEFLMINHHNKFPFRETYGFRYSHDKYPWQMESPKMAVKFTSKEHMDHFFAGIGALHHIEHFHKIKPTTVHLVESKLTNTVVLEFDKFWITKCLTFNVYTLLLKLCTMGMNSLPFDKLIKVTINKKLPTEVSYLSELGKDRINAVIENLPLINSAKSKYVDGTNKFRDSYDVHGNSGLMYFKYRLNAMDELDNNYEQEFANTVWKIMQTPANNNFFKETA